ncbi:glycosyltransferase family 32 protein [Parabacteroides sp.]
MIPKIIHLCWFSDDPFPVEIKICLASWKRVLPDYTIRRWTYADAMAIGCDFITEALAAKKWAFAADAVRFYALYKEGGVYMDSDILLEKRFDSFIPEQGFATFNENWGEILLQAAFLIGEQGNSYCKEVFEHYNQSHFLLPDGSFDMLISPRIMVMVAEKRGYRREDVEQRLGKDVVIYPSRNVSPCKKLKYPEAFAHHQVYGSWRKHRLGRKVERFMKHIILWIRFALFKR